MLIISSCNYYLVIDLGYAKKRCASRIMEISKSYGIGKTTSIKNTWNLDTLVAYPRFHGTLSHKKL